MYYSNYCLLRFSLLDFECSMLQLLLTKLHFFLDIYCCKIDFYLEGSEQIFTQLKQISEVYAKHSTNTWSLSLSSHYSLTSRLILRRPMFTCVCREKSNIFTFEIFSLAAKNGVCRTTIRVGRNTAL